MLHVSCFTYLFVTRYLFFPDIHFSFCNNAITSYFPLSSPIRDFTRILQKILTIYYLRLCIYVAVFVETKSNYLCVPFINYISN